MNEEEKATVLSAYNEYLRTSPDKSDDEVVLHATNKSLVNTMRETRRALGNTRSGMGELSGLSLLRALGEHMVKHPDLWEEKLN